VVTVKIVVLWNVTPWSPADKHRRFGTECFEAIFRIEDKGNMFV